MINPYLPHPVEILNVKQETSDVKLFRLRFLDQKKQKGFYFWHGQFAEVGLAGVGEAPFDICSNSTDSTKYFEVAIRRVGRLTEVLHRLKSGAQLFVRAPLGKGWPATKFLQAKNLLLVGGGCGFVPLKSIIEEVSPDYAKKHQVQVFYGCSDGSQVLFKDRYQAWQKSGINLKIIFDKQKPSKKAINGIVCSYGLITKLFDTEKIVNNASAFLCGPPVMFKFVIRKLKERGFVDENIYVSLERRMYCGIGICQHCAIGDKYVCKDGPVFNYSEIKDIPNIFSFKTLSRV